MEITITKITDAKNLMSALIGIPYTKIEVKRRLSPGKELVNAAITNIAGMKTDGKEHSTAIIITTETMGPMWPGKTPKVITSTYKVPVSQIINVKIKNL